MSGRFLRLPHSRAMTLGCVLLATAGLASAIFGAGYAIYFRTPFPFQDMVETMEFLDGNPALWRGESFTRLHDMEHQPALPAFIWNADRLLSGSSGLMPLLVSHLALTVTALLGVWNWTPRLQRSAVGTWMVPTAALGMMFSLTNWHNLVWEKQLHVAMSLLFLVTAAHCAARLSPVDAGSGRPQHARNLLLAALAAWAGKFSFGYGLPAMPVITIHGALARWPWRYVSLSASVSAIFLAAYYYFFSLGGRSPEELGDRQFDLVVMIAYIARLLAGVVAGTDLHLFAEVERSVLALGAGLVLLGLYLFGTARLYWRSLRLRIPPSRNQSVSLIVSSACVAIALMTWLSRPEATYGLVSRYYIVSTLFILSLPGLFMSARGWQQINVQARTGVTGISCVFVVLSVMGHLANFTAPPLRWHAAAVAAIGADMGIYIPEMEALIGPPLHQWEDKTFAVWAAHRLRLEERDHGEPFVWRGRDVKSVFDSADSRGCVGEVKSIESIPGRKTEFVFTGWTYHDAILAAVADWIVVVDPTGRIIGLGAPWRPSAGRREWLEGRFNEKPGLFANLTGVAGYLSAPLHTEISFFSVKGSKACLFATHAASDRRRR